ncbi:MAG: flagellar operon protein [Lachnospiraceae bacterium]|jgi:flagellar operon protein|nr:flagellar operon protein [Lachnospiraceae bacterium]MCI9589510.1 flagellar operon protein [Lachnospiraceae bacterium]MDE6930320.1 flagellar operon protein [Lachnospiraceae bacterium]
MDVNRIQKLHGVQQTSQQTGVRTQGGAGTNNFQELLRAGAKEGLNFSKHAAKRLDERGIHMDNTLMDNLEHVVEEARKKGARDVAVIGSQGIFIVNVPNNVVVTTMTQNDLKDKIFTNIDSAVFM